MPVGLIVIINVVYYCLNRCVCVVKLFLTAFEKLFQVMLVNVCLVIVCLFVCCCCFVFKLCLYDLVQLPTNQM